VIAQQLDASAVIRGIDTAVKARSESIVSYTVTEHYAVFRNHDESHPIAEMTVKTDYRKDTGKSYTILSQTGSSIVRNVVLDTLLEHEKQINQPDNRKKALFVSANYEMELKPSGTQRIDGRNCLALAISPRRKAPNLIRGTLWVDAKDYTVVQIEGTSSKNPSIMTGPTQVFRQYTSMNGFSQATHAKATSNSSLFGETIVKIDYQGYDIHYGPAS
jgi:outer membrane lipoprotein-sorting protein